MNANAPKIVFLSFGDSRLAASLKRIKAQAAALGLFDRAVLVNELGLERAFVRRKADIFRSRTRGFGFWTWKPYLIERELLRLRDGDVLVYSDAGNHFEPANKGRLAEYIDLARTAATQIVAPALSSRFIERHWTKAELLRHLGVEADEALLSSPQTEANFIVIVNNPGTRRFMRQWNALHEAHLDLFDDSRALPQAEGFVDHRHDQSAFSVLGKIHGLKVIPEAIDDFVLRRRDKVATSSPLPYLLFLLKNGLLLSRLSPVRP
jgi:hypothetical protein